MWLCLWKVRIPRRRRRAKISCSCSCSGGADFTPGQRCAVAPLERQLWCRSRDAHGSFFLRAERANVLRREHCPEAYSPPRGPPGLNSARGLRADVKGHRTSAPRASSRQHGRRTMAGIPQRPEHAQPLHSESIHLGCRQSTPFIQVGSGWRPFVQSLRVQRGAKQLEAKRP